MKLGTLVHHVHGYTSLPQIFQFLPGDLDSDSDSDSDTYI